MQKQREKNRDGDGGEDIKSDFGTKQREGESKMEIKRRRTKERQKHRRRGRI